MATEEESADASSPRWRGRASRAALVIVVLIAVAIAVVQWRHAHDLGAQAHARRQVATVAGRFGESLLSYNYQHLDEAQKRLLRNGTKRFAREYSGAFAGGLETAITGLQATSTASVRDVYVTDIVGNSARAVVTLDSEVRSSAATRRTVNSYLDMALVRQRGQWKVDSVISVASLDEQTTPNTSAPAPPAAPAPPG